MQPEPTEHSQNASASAHPDSPSSSTQHGLFGGPSDLTTPPLLPSGERGSIGGSSTEWSLSPTSELASPGSSDVAGLSPYEGSNQHDANELDLENLSLSLTPTATQRWIDRSATYQAHDGDRFGLQEFPEELLFHVMSHLPATDLLTLKLVSRRLYALVTSPTAWSNAFSKYFPGPESLRASTALEAEKQQETLHTEARVFTRLSASVSWSSEYLTRTRLLRALMRGRPSLPFAAPCPGKPGKGSATFTFSSRIWRGCTALDADFGSISDKRKPQFIHGSSLSGSVSSSDRRGKFDAWGLSNPVFLRHFHEIHPGTQPYGMGSGTCIGVPNIMEVSQQYGMIYGEGTPGGNLLYYSAGEKNGRVLTSFTSISNNSEGIPLLSKDIQCPTALWIAKSASIPRLSQGLVGMLAGSSNGIITAYSTGSQGGQRYERGEMTARWMLSPGVPIVCVCADEQYSEERQKAGRVWAFALNALGELFYIGGLPVSAPKHPALRNATPEELAEKEELRAWQTGQSQPWSLASETIRQSKYADISDDDASGLPAEVQHGVQPADTADQTSRLQSWFIRSPIEVRSEFPSWDMRRRLTPDFANDDKNGSGESVVLISEGHDGTVASVIRLTRAKAHADPQHQGTALMHDGSDRWLRTHYLSGIYSFMQITAIGIDHSINATTTIEEDSQLQKARTTTRHGRAPRPEATTPQSPGSVVPGRRGRLFAVGTSSGFIFVWDIRAAHSKALDLTNDVQPVRVIVTDSPGISSVALSSLYLVHGGSEGLLQAWDLLASTTEPLRTLSSRRLVNNRRRAILAAQQASVPTTWAAQNTERLAASAICLDPDPTVLRGVATIDSWIKYWSFSSATSAEEMSRSQKRKLKRGNGSKNPSLVGGGDVEASYGQRRSNLKSYVDHELHQRAIDEAEQRRASKQDKRLAGRFGTNLLGADASEEDMIAYATMLSREENERERQKAAESAMKLSRNASTDEIEAYKATLSESDAEKWKYASWSERKQMVPQGIIAIPDELLNSQSQVATPTAEDTDLKQAMEMSLEEQHYREQFQTSRASSTPPQAGSSKDYDASQLRNDPDLAEAIALSLSEGHGTPSSPHRSGANPHTPSRLNDEDDLARAIRLSLADEQSSSPVSDAQPRSEISDDHFPSLSSSSPPSGSRSAGSCGRNKGKGPKGAW